MTFSGHKASLIWLLEGNEGFGVRRATMSLARALHLANCRVAFASITDGVFAAEIRAEGYEIWVLELETSSSSRLERASFFRNIYHHVRRQMKLRRQLLDIIQLTRPDWLHVRHNHLLPLAGLAACATGLPVYWHLPNTINRRLPLNLQALGYQLFCRWAGIRPLGNSRHTADSLGYTFVKPRVLHLGIDPVHFNPSAAFPSLTRAAVGLEEVTPVFAIIARVVPEKAQDRVLEAVIQLLKAGVRLQLVIIGGPVESEFYRRLQARVTAAGVGHAVKLLPPVSDPRPWFSLADVIINSRTGAEPFGLTVVEAMLMERPVLAYRAGGPSETIIDNRTGWLIDEPSVQGYVQGIRRALKDRNRWKEIGTTGRAHAKKYFTTETMVYNYIQIVNSDKKFTA